MVARFLAAVSFIVFAVVGLPLHAANLDRPSEKAAFEFHQRLMEGKFEELERIADAIRKSDTKTSDGQPLLAALYWGVSGCFGEDCAKRAQQPIWADKKYKLLLAWRKMVPDSVTAELAVIHFFINRAWDARGTSYSNRVTASAWQLFGVNLDRAQKRLDEASPAAKNDPGWYGASLSVGLGSAWPKQRFDKIFREGSAKYPLYLPLYFNASSYYAPRWHGSEEAYRQFIEQAVTQTRPQLGETLYARLHWSLWTSEMFKDGTADWRRMRAGFERIEKDYPDDWNLNNFAKFACMAGDRETLARLTREIGHRPLETVWGSNGYYGRCRSYAGVRDG